MTDRDPQDVAEALDPDELSEDDDPEGLLEYPPERPMGVEDYGTTAAEERVDEPLARRVRREEPEGVAPADRDRVGRLVQPGDDEVFALDDETDAVATAFDEADLAAEESAMHLTAAPPMGPPGDGYLDDGDDG